MHPSISVIIPTYNTQEYVERAIQSVLNQTFQNLEVVVVDDASTDETVDRIRGIIDERIKLFVQPQNLGASAARNRAIKAAQGTWIALLDSDDWYAPERLEKLLEVAQSEHADIVADDLSLIRKGDDTAWSTLIRESGQPVSKPLIIDSVYLVETDQYGKQCLHLGLTKPIIKRAFLLDHDLGYDESIKVTHDFWLYLSCLLAGARFVVVPESYYFLFSRPGSLMSSSQVKRLDEDLKATQRFLSLASVRRNPGLVAALSKNEELYRRSSNYYHVVEPLKAGNWSLAFKEMLQRPYFFKHFIMQLPKVIWLRIEFYLFKNRFIARKTNFNIN